MFKYFNNFSKVMRAQNWRGSLWLGRMYTPIYAFSTGNKLNISINNMILQAPDTQGLFKILTKQQFIMNLINYSTLLKQINKFNTKNLNQLNQKYT